MDNWVWRGAGVPCTTQPACMAGQATQARSSTGNQIQPAGARPFVDKKRGSRKKTRNRRPEPSSSHAGSQTKRKIATLHAHACPLLIPAEGVMANWRSALGSHGTDAAHASRHTWRASEPRKASISLSERSLSGLSSEKSRIHWL